MRGRHGLRLRFAAVIRRSQAEGSVRASRVEVADVDAENVLELAAAKDPARPRRVHALGVARPGRPPERAADAPPAQRRLGAASAGHDGEGREGPRAAATGRDHARGRGLPCSRSSRPSGARRARGLHPTPRSARRPIRRPAEQAVYWVDPFKPMALHRSTAGGTGSVSPGRESNPRQVPIKRNAAGRPPVRRQKPSG